MSASLGPIATHLHSTPAAAAISTGIQEQPTAAGALFHSVQSLGGQQIRRQPYNRPEYPVERIVAICPIPSKALYCGDESQPSQRLRQHTIQYVQVLQLWRSFIYDRFEDPVNRSPQDNGTFENGIRLCLAVFCLLKQMVGIFVCQDTHILAPENEVGIAGEKFPWMVALAPIHSIGEGQTQLSADYLKGICIDTHGFSRVLCEHLVMLNCAPNWHRYIDRLYKPCYNLTTVTSITG